MGGSRPSAPTVVMPAPTAPTLYKSVTAPEDYAALAEQLKRIQTETGKIQEQRYSEVGTPAELAARMAGARLSETGSYLASLPKDVLEGSSDPMKAVKWGAEARVSKAGEEYAGALTRLSERPKPTISETPAWGKLPTTDSSASTPAPAPAAPSYAAPKAPGADDKYAPGSSPAAVAAYEAGLIPGSPSKEDPAVEARKAAAEKEMYDKMYWGR